MLFSKVSIFIGLLVLSVVSRAELTAFEQDEKWGYRDEQNKVVIKPQFIMANDFSEQGIASAIDQQGWAYINKDGLVILRPFVFDNGPDYFVEGLARFVQQGKMGFFNEKGEIIIPAQFDFVWPFSEGTANFCMGCKEVPFDGEHHMVTGGQWGKIDKHGKIIVEATFASATELENSYNQ